MSESAKPAAKHSAKPAASAVVDRVTVVPRNVDGTARLNERFRLLVREGATDEEKRAAWNLGGELPPEDVIEYVPEPYI